MLVTKLMVVLAVVGACLALSLRPGPVYGEPVPDHIAAQLRGGLCQMLDVVSCPYQSTACTACMKVTSGPNQASGAGECPCSSSCGSFFSRLADCY